MYGSVDRSLSGGINPSFRGRRDTLKMAIPLSVRLIKCQPFNDQKEVVGAMKTHLHTEPSVGNEAAKWCQRRTRKRKRPNILVYQNNRRHLGRENISQPINLAPRAAPHNYTSEKVPRRQQTGRGSGKRRARPLIALFHCTYRHGQCGEVILTLHTRESVTASHH